MMIDLGLLLLLLHDGGWLLAWRSEVRFEAGWPRC